MNRVIITAVDTVPRYVDGVKAWLKSLAVNAPDEKVMVYAQNWDDVTAISSINPNAEIVRVCNDSSDPLVRNYIRYDILTNLLPRYDAVAWIDNDAIIRWPLGGLWDGVVPNSVKYWHRNRREHLCFQGGVFVLGAGKKSEKYCGAISAKLKTMKSDNAEERWYAPQTYAYSYVALSGLSIVPMDMRYNDSTFMDDSVIWHCKSSHFADPKYQKEYQHYLGMIK